MAKDYLGIPGIFTIFIVIYLIISFINNFLIIATSAPAERIFSSASDVVTSDRACLAPETIQAIMSLKHWYRSGILD